MDAIVQECASLHILELRVFLPKNSFLLGNTDILSTTATFEAKPKLAVNTDTDVRGSAQKRCFLLEQNTRRPTKYTDVFCWVGHGCTFFIRDARPAASQECGRGSRECSSPDTHERRRLQRSTSRRRARRGHYRKQHPSDPARL